MKDAIATNMHAEEHALWELHVQDPSEQTLANLLAYYMPIARGIVRDFHLYDRADLDLDDVLQVAMMGLVEALQRFEPDRGIAFRSYATRRVKGAVLDLLRRTDVLSRREREDWGRIQAAITDFLGKEGRFPQDEELAQALGLSVDRLRMLTIRVKTVLSLDMAYDDKGDGKGGGCLLDTLLDESCEEPSTALIREEQYARFRAAFRRLDDREQKVLYLYYYEDLTLREIGQVMDLTEARICQIHAKSLLHLRVILGRSKVIGESVR